MYQESVRLHRRTDRARMRASSGSGVDFEQVKARMERWVAKLDSEEPHAVLGVSPRASPEQVRERYLELAKRHHPDHGGDPERMRVFNQAYAKIRQRDR
jgi:DnaJ-domain-containing protein 1